MSKQQLHSKVYSRSQEKNSEEYPPNSLYQMVCGLQRQIKKKPTVNLFSPTYTDVSKTSHDSELKRLKAKGLGMTVNKAEPISLKEEELLWESGALGDTGSMTLS